METRGNVKRIEIISGRNNHKMRDMGIGQMGRIVYGNSVGAFRDEIILRIYSGVVSLSDPINFWSNFREVEMDIELLPAGTLVTIEAQ